MGATSGGCPTGALGSGPRRARAPAPPDPGGLGQGPSAFRQVFTSLFIPDGTTGDAVVQRAPAGVGDARVAPMCAAFFELDVRALAPKSGLRPASSLARVAAASSSLVLGSCRSSRNHLILESEPGWPRFVGEVRASSASRLTKRSSPSLGGIGSRRSSTRPWTFRAEPARSSWPEGARGSRAPS